MLFRSRAIIKEPEILIFDDCLSAADTETEEIILNNLYNISKDKTTIIVSHRISSLKHADVIIYMNGGRIIETGTHDQLMELKHSYFSIYYSCDNYLWPI